MEIIIIAAMAANRVIGDKNRIPWSIPEDLRQFKAKTLGHAVIMGRKTYESLGRPLKGRHNIVLSRRPDFHPAGCSVVSDLPQALDMCSDQKKVFVIGGGEIFNLGLAIADKLILSLIEREVPGDTLFPDFSSLGFVETHRELFTQDEAFSVITYQRTTDKKHQCTSASISAS